MPTAAIYARYSTDEQRETSIEDQVRRCRQTAAKEGFSVDDEFVFSDSAVSGTAKGRAKRVGYQRLLDAIHNGLVDVVIIDDVSRVARNMVEGATLMEIAEQKGLRIITCDGIDSKQRDWTLLWSFKLITAVQEVKGTADKVVRGMVGQLERGYQIAQPAFGYVGVREGSPNGRDGGTKWELHPERADIVRRMYHMRFEGASVAGLRHVHCHSALICCQLLCRHCAAAVGRLAFRHAHAVSQIAVGSELHEACPLALAARLVRIGDRT